MITTCTCRKRCAPAPVHVLPLSALVPPLESPRLLALRLLRLLRLPHQVLYLNFPASPSQWRPKTSTTQARLRAVACSNMHQTFPGVSFICQISGVQDAACFHPQHMRMDCWIRSSQLLIRTGLLSGVDTAPAIIATLMRHQCSCTPETHLQMTNID